MALWAGDHLPKIFISELRWRELSSESQMIIQGLINGSHEEDPLQALIQAKKPWNQVAYAEYQQLLLDSEYAAWLSVMGIRANHFTVSVNHLKSFNNLAEVNALLVGEGYQLNRSGGEIKGNPNTLLEQSSTEADRIKIPFRCGIYAQVPSCYYEFALRYPDQTGRLFQGFVPASANQIFESTNHGLLP